VAKEEVAMHNRVAELSFPEVLNELYECEIMGFGDLTEHAFDLDFG
jgi:hypothetical protein